MGQPPTNEDNIFQPLIHNPLVVIASHQHPLAKRASPLSFSDIAAEQFVIREKGSGTRLAIESHFSERNWEVMRRLSMQLPVD